MVADRAGGAARAVAWCCTRTTGSVSASTSAMPSGSSRWLTGARTQPTQARREQELQELGLVRPQPGNPIAAVSDPEATSPFASRRTRAARSAYVSDARARDDRHAVWCDARPPLDPRADPQVGHCRGAHHRSIGHQARQRVSIRRPWPLKTIDEVEDLTLLSAEPPSTPEPRGPDAIRATIRGPGPLKAQRSGSWYRPGPSGEARRAREQRAPAAVPGLPVVRRLATPCPGT